MSPCCRSVAEITYEEKGKDQRIRNVHMKCCIFFFYHFLKHLQQFETKRKKKVTNRIDLQFASVSKRYINKTHIINISFYKHINSVVFLNINTFMQGKMKYMNVQQQQQYTALRFVVFTPLSTLSNVCIC